MKHFLIKANSKKLKWFNTKPKQNIGSSSNSELSSEDESSLSENENIMYEYINNRYLCIKYLGRGAFARVWCVLDIIDNKYYAMKVFLNVVEFEGFSAAASHLGISRASVSTQVIQLEESLGARLLNRTTRRVSVTEVGEAYYERCKRVLELEPGREERALRIT